VNEVEIVEDYLVSMDAGPGGEASTHKLHS
jgi:hypothetical protein